MILFNVCGGNRDVNIKVALAWGNLPHPPGNQWINFAQQIYPHLQLADFNMVIY